MSPRNLLPVTDHPEKRLVREKEENQGDEGVDLAVQVFKKKILGHQVK